MAADPADLVCLVVQRLSGSSHSATDRRAIWSPRGRRGKSPVTVLPAHQQTKRTVPDAFCFSSRGSTILPFARLTPDDRAFWLLGPANYVSHEGERPMAITWRLAHELPGDLFARFGAAVS